MSATLSAPRNRPPRPATRQSPLAPLVRQVRWHRRAVAAVCAALAVLAAIGVLAPRATATRDVVVASHDLAAGARVSSADLTIAHYPVDLAPASALANPADALQHTLSTAVGAGTPITTSAFTSSASLASPGQQLVPFHLADASVLSLLHVGDTVSVVTSTTDQQAVVLARQVRVAALPQGSGSGGLLGSSQGNGAVVVVSCDPETAARLAASAGSSQLGVTVG